MKVLFITKNDVDDINGGAMASRRNLECIQDIFGKENVVFHLIVTKQQQNLLDRIRNFFGKLFYDKIDPSFSKLGICPDDYDILFIDRSLMGWNIRQLKRNGYQGKIISFFHNCEFDYNLMFVKKNDTIGNRLYLRSIKANETWTLMHSDACVFINERDRARMKELYGIEAKDETVITMTLRDKFQEGTVSVATNKNVKPLYTILGSYFLPNIEGIKWFIENVYPHVNIRLRIIGKNMHLLRSEIKNKEIEILSNVPDLTHYMVESDYMLYPIFDGSGMKIKTCEALMWGKNIVGTPEAFSGYGITDYSKVGACCETAEEFIEIINSLNMPKFNQWNRQFYKDNFSYEKSVNLYQKLINRL